MPELHPPNPSTDVRTPAPLDPRHEAHESSKPLLQENRDREKPSWTSVVLSFAAVAAIGAALVMHACARAADTDRSRVLPTALPGLPSLR